jgi:hypothetical protein
MSARIFTFVTPSPCSSQLVTEALAAPFPFCSIPLAASTMRLRLVVSLLQRDRPGEGQRDTARASC